MWLGIPGKDLLATISSLTVQCSRWWGLFLSTLRLQEELNITLFSLFDFEDLPLLAVDQLNLNCSSVSAEVFIDGKGTVGNTSGVYTHSFCSGQSLIAEPGTHLSGMWDRAAGIGV